MICPVCKNCHPDWFATHELVDAEINVTVTRLAFICKKCGVLFLSTTPEGADFWYKKRAQEREKILGGRIG